MVDVLLVDDKQQEAEVIGKVLEKEGADVQVATSPGGIAVEASEYDYVVSDFRMENTEMNGLEVLVEMPPGPTKILYTGLSEDSPEIPETDLDYIHVVKPGYKELKDAVLGD